MFAHVPRIAVIGLGTMGSQALWQLAQRGVDVIGIEAFAPGHDRGAAGGESRIFRSAHFEDSHYVPLLKRADSLWGELERDTGRQLRTLIGCLLMGPVDHVQMRTALASVQEHDLDHELLDQQDLQARFPQFHMDDEDVALLDRRAGFVRPELTVLSAVLRAEELGAQVWRYCRVLELRPSGAGVRIVTTSGDVDVDRAVVTAGPWISQLVPSLAEIITVRRPISAWYVPRDPDLKVPGLAFIRTAPRHFYGVPSVDGISVKLGLSVEDHIATDNPDDVERVVRTDELKPFAEVLGRYLPGLHADPIRLQTYLEGYTDDSRPWIGASPESDHIVVLAGFSGHGFKLSPAVGSIAADLALDGKSSLPIDFLSRTSPDGGTCEVIQPSPERTSMMSTKSLLVPPASTEQNFESFSIGRIACAPGRRIHGLLPVGTGFNSEEIGIPVIVVHGAFAGPVLCVDAGVHGDEYDSMEAVRRVASEVDAATLRGTLVAIPCMNQPAFQAATRVSGIDQANLNRIFPGDREGSFSMRLAATFVAEVVPVIDALVDLHTGGTFGEIAPLALVQRGHEDIAMELGMAAGHAMIWKGGAWGGTARSSVLDAGKPAVTLEAGGGTYRDEIADLHAESIRNVMRHFRMVDGEETLRPSHFVVDATFSRTASGGFFVAKVAPGQTCLKGQELCLIVDHYGEIRERISAPEDGVVVWVRRLRTVLPGDEVMIYGPIEGEIRQ